MTDGDYLGVDRSVKPILGYTLTFHDLAGTCDGDSGTTQDSSTRRRDG